MIGKPSIAGHIISGQDQLAAWLSYFFKARHRYGHGIHSPFVFDFITSVLNDRKHYDAYDVVMEYRKSMKKNRAVIGVTDFGAGSKTGAAGQRIVADIADHAAVNRKFGQLLYRLVQYYQPEQIIEFGTSLGISTHYLAAGNREASMRTFEADPALAAIAAEGLKNHRLDHVQVICDTFDHALQKWLSDITGRTLVFIDGNHSRSATLKYADFFLSRIPKDSIMVFDDIHWSAGMQQAWKEIQTREEITLSIDLFFMGIVFIKRDFFKENYTIRF